MHVGVKESFWNSINNDNIDTISAIRLNNSAQINYVDLENENEVLNIKSLEVIYIKKAQRSIQLERSTHSDIIIPESGVYTKQLFVSMADSAASDEPLRNIRHIFLIPDSVEYSGNIW